MKNTRNTFLACSLAFLGVTASSQAQVAVTVGAEEVYDNNIFLENNDRVSTAPANIDPNDKDSLKPYDGNPDEDYITNLSLSLSGNIPLTRYLKTNAEGRIGTLLFADNSDEDRVLIDSNVEMESTEDLLGKPGYAKIASVFTSQSQNIAVADGATARQSQTHTASFDTGIRQWEFSDTWDFSSIYQFRRVDSLGALDFSGNSAVDDEGSDYIANGVSTDLGHKFSDRLRGDWTSLVEYQSYTSVGSDSVEGLSSEYLDRLNYQSKLGATYQITDAWSVNGDAGFDASYYPDRSDSQPVIVENEDGTFSTLENKSDEIAFVYTAGTTYSIDQYTSVNVLTDQRSGTNIDGRRVMSRSVAISFISRLSDNLTSSTGGRYLQYQNGDTFNNATERYEVTAALSYNITQALALSAGWNYVTQNAGGSGSDSFSSDDDYDSVRAFVGLSSGLVGTPASLW